MGIPIESRLSKAALAKRQRSAALRKTRHIFNYVAPGQTTPFGLYQENLNNLISHAQETPPQSARLILVSKDLSSPVQVRASPSSIIQLFPIFMRHARHGRMSGEHASTHLRSANTPVRGSSPSHQNHETRSSERRNTSSRAPASREPTRRTLLQFNRLVSPYTSARASHPSPTSRRVHSPVPEASSRPLSISRGSTNQLHQSPTSYMRRNSQTDSGIWNTLRRSMLLAASADSLSRAQMWGRLLDRNDRDNSTGPRTNVDEDISPALEFLDRRVSPSNAPNRTRDNHMMSDKAISMLYEIDDGFLWELGCWLGTQHLRTTDIFGILVEVLEKTSEVPGSPVEALCIQDNLFSYSTVRGGVRLLKELSGHLHEHYDRTSNFFVHPMNDQRVQIIVSP